MTVHHIDGNGIAGLLAELGAADLTSAVRTCHGCGDASPLAAHRAYRGAAMVLRCPGCDAVAMVLGRLGDRLLFECVGTLRTAAP